MKGKPVSDLGVEIVERKGLGHPDHMCDSIMEAVSVALSSYYLREFGAVLHHNIDKGLLAAGRVRKRFGGGRVMRPMELVIGDRATFEAQGRKVPAAEIAVEAARGWLRRNMGRVDPERHVRYRSVLSGGSEELTDIFLRPGAVRGANDTSAAVGYWPLSPAEEAVLGIERYLNSRGFKERFPETGQDVKVMGLRRGRVLELTVAMPLLAGDVRSEKEYFEKKEAVLADLLRQAGPLAGGFERTEFHLNALDERGRGLGGVYLSLLGTSAEDADSGQVGRGNRVNGLISVNRPMGTEAAAGKNPVSHVGKIYNVLAHHAAQRIWRSVEGVREVYVLLLSRIGAPVDAPLMASVQLLLERGAGLGDVSAGAREALEEELSGVARLTAELAAGKHPVC
ncbi:MAG: methionine adenosyltransferase [Thermodesulfovibrionales bacterium]